MPSTIDTALQQRLSENGFTEDQITQMGHHGVQPSVITTILDANLDPTDLQTVFTVIASLAAQLPQAADFQLYPQEDDIPTIATYVRNLSVDDKNLVGEIYKSLSGNRYIFDMASGYVQLRSLHAEPLS